MSAPSALYKGPAASSSAVAAAVSGSGSSVVGGGDESSESEAETEPAKCFHRRLSTNENINSSKCIKEGFLMKQTNSFQRWSRCYFKLKPRKLFYAKDVKFVIYNEIDLIDTSIAECSMKNINHSFQVITPCRNLVLCADSRKEMEEWIAAIRSATSELPFADPRELVLSPGHHSWCTFPHVRPLYCNVCREALSGVTRSGVTLNGLSCEVCKLKVHKRCAARAVAPCKWTTLSSVGNDIIEEDDGTITMPHQWVEGNLPVNAKCCQCDKTCGSIRRLKDYWCLWCHSVVHSTCRSFLPKECSLGQVRISVLPPTAITSLDSDGFWRATKPPGASPLLVFLNSKSGDNQGVKMLWKFKQLLNPAQVFDLMNGGPKMGLRLFQNFESFRVLVCGGDGSIGWVLNEIDKLGLHKQCQVGVLPLGTGNDLSRVLGWGGNFDDETQLPSVLDRLEHAQIKMLDRWSIFSYESSVLNPRRLSSHCDPSSAYEDVANYLSRILHSDSYNVVITSAAHLCERVTELTDKMVSFREDDDDSISDKCSVLKEKMKALMMTLNEESQAASEQMFSRIRRRGSKENRIFCASSSEDLSSAWHKVRKEPEPDAVVATPASASVEPVPLHSGKPLRYRWRTRQPPAFRQRDQLMSRANSLKKAIRQIIEHAEKAVDDQNAQTLQFELENEEHCDEAHASRGHSPTSSKIVRLEPLMLPRIVEPEDLYDEDAALSPPPSATALTPPVSLNVPIITTDLTNDEDDCQEQCVHSNCRSGLPPIVIAGLLSPPGRAMSSLAVPGYAPSLYLSSDESSACSTPGMLTPGQMTPSAYSTGEMTPGALSPSALDSEIFTPFGCASPVPDQDYLCTSPTPSSRSSKPFKKQRHIRKISRLSALNPINQMNLLSSVSHERSPSRESASSFPLLNIPLLHSLPGQGSSNSSMSSVGGSFIGKVLLANADALCAAATPLVEDEEINLDEYDEKCVMNNYFGIGLDAKIALDFHQKREEHPEKCRSRTKNMMWFGVLGGKEIVAKTFKNLEQKVKLECDGQPIPLPNLQGIVVLNIPSYMGGTNFWGGTKEDDNFIAPSFDDNVLEVVAVFGCMQLGISRVINLQRHRIAQCHTVKITITGDEGVPVQVDGEAWVQPPGFIYLAHKNRAQMLTRDKVFEEALKTWTEKQKFEKPVNVQNNDVLSSEESVLLHSFVESAETLIRSVKLASICNGVVEQELLHLATQASGFLDRLYPDGRLSRPLSRIQVSDLVSSVQSLYNETQLFLADKTNVTDLRQDIVETMAGAMTSMDATMKDVYEIGGLPHCQTMEPEVTQLHRVMSKEKGKSRWAFIRGPRKERYRESRGPSALSVQTWSTEEVGQWLTCLDLGEHKEAFAAHDIRGRELLSLSRTDLKELGVTKVGHVKRIQQAVKDIKKSSVDLVKST